MKKTTRRSKAPRWFARGLGVRMLPLAEHSLLDSLHLTGAPEGDVEPASVAVTGLHAERALSLVEAFSPRDDPCEVSLDEALRAVVVENGDDDGDRGLAVFALHGGGEIGQERRGFLGGAVDVDGVPHPHDCLRGVLHGVRTVTFE